MLTPIDPHTGVRRCIMDATLVTAVRTGARTVVVAKHLARGDVRVVGQARARPAPRTPTASCSTRSTTSTRCESSPPTRVAGGVRQRLRQELRAEVVVAGHRLGTVAVSPSFAERGAEDRGRGMATIQARVALARHACRLPYRRPVTQQPFDEQAYRRGPPVRAGPLIHTARAKACRPTAA